MMQCPSSVRVRVHVKRTERGRGMEEGREEETWQRRAGYSDPRCEAARAAPCRPNAAVPPVTSPPDLQRASKKSGYRAQQLCNYSKRPGREKGRKEEGKSSPLAAGAPRHACAHPSPLLSPWRAFAPASPGAHVQGGPSPCVAFDAAGILHLSQCCAQTAVAHGCRARMNRRARTPPLRS